MAKSFRSDRTQIHNTAFTEKSHKYTMPPLKNKQKTIFKLIEVVDEDPEPTWPKVSDQTGPKSTTLLSVRSHTINILSPPSKINRKTILKNRGGYQGHRKSGKIPGGQT